jgi:hypothetical protein
MSAGGGLVRKKSRFTFKQLAQLALSSTSCPLRVVVGDILSARILPILHGFLPGQAILTLMSSGTCRFGRLLRTVRDGAFERVGGSTSGCPAMVFFHSSYC